MIRGKSAGDCTVKELLAELRRVTETHFKKSGKWTVWEQIGHTHSEVSELWERLRQNTTPVFQLIEIWDIVFSAITNAHVLEYTDDQLFGGLALTLDKIRERVGLES